MLLRAFRFLTLLLAALSMSMAFCHLLQLPPRMSYDAALWRETQSMYLHFGPPIGAILETGAWISAVLLVFFVRGGKPAFWWSSIGAAGFVAAQAIWWLLIFPVNNEIVKWTPESMPPNWAQYRSQWEYTHATRAVLQILAFCALLASVLAETPRRAATSPPSP